jgi:hypothetical protein
VLIQSGVPFKFSFHLDKTSIEVQQTVQQPNKGFTKGFSSKPALGKPIKQTEYKVMPQSSVLTYMDILCTCKTYFTPFRLYF